MRKNILKLLGIKNFSNYNDFTFLDFIDENQEKDLFYLEKIKAVNFFENEAWIVLDNTKWEDAYNELKSMWMFWIENFSYFVDLLFTWKTKNKRIIDCLNINSRIKKNNYIELFLQIRGYKTNNQIVLKRVFQNIENDVYENYFYYYENGDLVTTISNDEIVKRKFRTIKIYNRTLILSQILYICIYEKNNYQNELKILEKEKNKYENEKLKQELINKYNEVFNTETHITNILNQYNKEKIYEIMDYVNKNPRTFAKDENILYIEKILNFLYNIWFTNIPQEEANKIFDIVDKDLIKYNLYFPIKDLTKYFYFIWKEYENKPFENFIYFFNTLLTWNKNEPIDIKNIEFYKKEWIKTIYNEKDFWDYVKQTLLDKNGNIRLEVLEFNFLSDD